MGGETSPKTGVELPGESCNESACDCNVYALVDGFIPHNLLSLLCSSSGGRTFGLHRTSSSSCLISLDMDQQFVIVGGFEAGAAVGFVDR